MDSAVVRQCSRRFRMTLLLTHVLPPSTAPPMPQVWLVPFGFFISLSVNESTLPDRWLG